MLAARVEQKNGTYLHSIQRDRRSLPHPAGVAMFGINPDRRSQQSAVRGEPHEFVFRGIDAAASLKRSELQRTGCRRAVFRGIDAAASLKLHRNNWSPALVAWSSAASMPRPH